MAGYPTSQPPWPQYPGGYGQGHPQPRPGLAGYPQAAPGYTPPAAWQPAAELPGYPGMAPAARPGAAPAALPLPAYQQGPRTWQIPLSALGPSVASAPQLVAPSYALPWSASGAPLGAREPGHAEPPLPESIAPYVEASVYGEPVEEPGRPYWGTVPSFEREISSLLADSYAEDVSSLGRMILRYCQLLLKDLDLALVDVDSDIVAFGWFGVFQGGDPNDFSNRLSSKLELRTELGILQDGVKSLELEIKGNRDLVARRIDDLWAGLLELYRDDDLCMAEISETEKSLDRYKRIWGPYRATRAAMTETQRNAINAEIQSLRKEIGAADATAIGAEAGVQAAKKAAVALAKKLGSRAAAAAIPGIGWAITGLLVDAEGINRLRLSEKVSSLRDLSEAVRLEGKAATDKIDKVIKAKEERIRSNRYRIEENKKERKAKEDEMARLKKEYSQKIEEDQTKIDEARKQMQTIQALIDSLQPKR